MRLVANLVKKALLYFHFAVFFLRLTVYVVDLFPHTQSFKHMQFNVHMLIIM